MSDGISDFTLGILDQIRLRQLDASKVNPWIADTLEKAGLVEAVEPKTTEPASSFVRHTGHYRWRITDAGLARLGKERVW